MKYIRKQDVLAAIESISSLDDNLKVFHRLRTLDTVELINCAQCRFHMDCKIEKLLPESDNKFCSYAKSNI